MKTVDISETIAASGPKIGRSVNESSQGHFLTLVQGYLHIKIKTCFSQKPQGHFQPNFVCKLLGTRNVT